jgi:hypothetical protein
MLKVQTRSGEQFEIDLSRYMITRLHSALATVLNTLQK